MRNTEGHTVHIRRPSRRTATVAVAVLVLLLLGGAAMFVAASDGSGAEEADATAGWVDGLPPALTPAPATDLDHVGTSPSAVGAGQIADLDAYVEWIRAGGDPAEAATDPGSGVRQGVVLLPLHRTIEVADDRGWHAHSWVSVNFRNATDVVRAWGLPSAIIKGIEAIGQPWSVPVYSGQPLYGTDDGASSASFALVKDPGDDDRGRYWQFAATADRAPSGPAPSDADAKAWVEDALTRAGSPQRAWAYLAEPFTDAQGAEVTTVTLWPAVASTDPANPEPHRLGFARPSTITVATVNGEVAATDVSFLAYRWVHPNRPTDLTPQAQVGVSLQTDVPGADTVSHGSDAPTTASNPEESR